MREGTSSHVVRLDYDFAKNRVAVGADGVDWNWAFDFTSGGELADVTNPTGQKLGLTYDPLGKLAGLNAGAKLQWKLQYTAGSPDLKLTDSQSVENTYSFDALYRLVQQKQGGADSAYEYAWSGDPNGLVTHDARQGNHCDVSRSPADIHNHIANRLFNINSNSYRSSNGFMDHVNFFCIGMFC